MKFKIGDFVQFRSEPEAHDYQYRNLKTCANPFVIADIVMNSMSGDYAVWDAFPHSCPGAYLAHLELAEGPW